MNHAATFVYRTVFGDVHHHKSSKLWMLVIAISDELIARIRMTSNQIPLWKNRISHVDVVLIQGRSSSSESDKRK
jgi:hypothetical protein